MLAKGSGTRAAQERQGHARGVLGMTLHGVRTFFFARTPVTETMTSQEHQMQRVWLTPPLAIPPPNRINAPCVWCTVSVAVAAWL